MAEDLDYHKSKALNALLTQKIDLTVSGSRFRRGEWQDLLPSPRFALVLIACAIATFLGVAYVI